LPLPRDECHQNARPDRWSLAKAKAADRLDGKNAALAAMQKAKMKTPPQWDNVIVDLHFRFPNRRGRDLLNYAAAGKFALDGIVDAGVVTDDKCTVIQRIGSITWSVDKANVGVSISITPVATRKVA
ncbi:MAG: hypothetical protein LC793_07320, partial [Thermomicrobia bacterium]|nr:hypothetical protein [Thermomicrobia bacterium]